MTVSPFAERKINLPSGQSVRLINEGEHHMGCSVVVFALSTPLAGIERFFTTNGMMLCGDPPDFCFLADGSLIVRIDTQHWTASHIARPAAERFGDLRLEGSALSYELVPVEPTSGLESRSITPDTGDWLAGLGPATEGFFPSAYKPACRTE